LSAATSQGRSFWLLEAVENWRAFPEEIIDDVLARLTTLFQ
jgi:hypothetical protein